MINLQEYIKESLLDDIDDLENTSDEIIKTHNTLLSYYDLNNIKIMGAVYLNKYIDKKAVKKLDADNNLNKDYQINSIAGKATKSPVAKYISMLVDYIMKLRIYDEFKVALKEKQMEKDSRYKYVTVNNYMPELYKKLSPLFTKDFLIRLYKEDRMMIDFLGYTNIEIYLYKK